MDIHELRQEFEKLPDIKGILHNSEFGFNEGINQYYHPNHAEHRLSYAFLMGAWLAWQAKAQAVPEGFVLVSAEQLKQLVESHELVKSRGGLDAAKHELILLQKHLNNTFGYVTIITSEKIENLKQAIADVESCMEMSSESN